MLFLSRHRGESILIGDDIVITVSDITQNQVRIGIEAPREVRVRRKEVKPDAPPAVSRDEESAQ